MGSIARTVMGMIIVCAIFRFLVKAPRIMQMPNAENS